MHQAAANCEKLSILKPEHAGIEGQLDQTALSQDRTAVSIGRFRNLCKRGRQQGEIYALAFHPDGHSAIVAGAGPEAPLYDLETGERLATLKGHETAIYAAAFQPDGQAVATAGFDGVVRIYDTSSGQLLTEFVPVPVAADQGEAAAHEE